MKKYLQEGGNDCEIRNSGQTESAGGCSFLPYGLPDDGFQSFRSAAAWIAEVNFMVFAA